ncbi:MAG: hypothetical protein QOE93_1169 [Actinomycetota bacterium]|jgi:hypothetical protein|nr:hypothetical protein [Actinomycetota bacterium]
MDAKRNRAPLTRRQLAPPLVAVLAVPAFASLSLFFVGRYRTALDRYECGGRHVVTGKLVVDRVRGDARYATRFGPAKALGSNRQAA